MRIEVHTKGFEKTDAVETFLNDQASDLVNEFLRNEGDIHIKINVDEDRHRTQARKPHFFCEVQLKTSGSKKWYKASRTSEEFRTAVHGAVHAMKNILQKRSDRRHDMKVNGSAINVPEEVELYEDIQENYEELRP